MAFFSYPGRDWTLEETPEGPRIIIPSPRVWPVAAFLALWLAGWTAGEISAVKQLWHIARHATGLAALLPGGFMVVWLLGWTAGGVFAWGVFLFSLKGAEVVTVSMDKLRIKMETFLGLGWTWKLDIPGMSPLRLAQDAPKDGEGAPAPDTQLPLDKYAHIALESGGRTWKLGVLLERQRAVELLHTLSSRFGLPRERK